MSANAARKIRKLWYMTAVVHDHSCCLYHLLNEGGVLYLSFPITTSTRSLTYFNAHRVINYESSLRMLKDVGFVIKDFSFVDDGGAFFKSITLDSPLPKLTYGLGIYVLTR